jgi:hypothetical protein
MSFGYAGEGQSERTTAAGPGTHGRVKTLLSNPPTARVVIASIALWLFFGWVWGDDWRWTIFRAFGATLSIFAVAALYTSSRVEVRITRVAIGSLLGGWCAYALGGGAAVVSATAAVFGALSVGAEYLIGRDLRRSSTHG